jgi:hypothetical protein
MVIYRSPSLCVPLTIILLVLYVFGEQNTPMPAGVTTAEAKQLVVIAIYSDSGTGCDAVAWVSS